MMEQWNGETVEWRNTLEHVIAEYPKARNDRISQTAECRIVWNKSLTKTERQWNKKNIYNWQAKLKEAQLNHYGPLQASGTVGLLS